MILILQVKKLGHKEVEKCAQASGRARWEAPEPLCSLEELHVTLPLSIHISRTLLTQNLLKGLGMPILFW